ncbi:hypothetical protein RIR_jg9465.t1 [Rhizophagus irregularis DAOM 181602=DAOM 197198]|nr:hypothetical protein RIR_jg9465.t1 [Rhizophagus irregularis DAOM 181602=DAOM 197198]
MQVQDTNSSSQTIAFDLIEQQTQDDVSHNPKRILLKKAQQFQIEEESSENSTDKRRYKDDLIKGRRVIHAVLIKEY